MNFSRTANLALNPSADTRHDDAAEMYSCYGAGFHFGDKYLDIHSISPEDLENKTDEEIIEESENLTKNEAEALLPMARRIFDAMVEIETELIAAVNAYEDGDLDGCIDRLETASHMENDHGDDPSTSDLADRLLVDLSDTPAAAYDLVELGTVNLRDGDGCWVAYSEGSTCEGYRHVVSEADWLRDDWPMDDGDDWPMESDNYTEVFCREATFATDEIAKRVGRALDLAVVHSATDGVCGMINCEEEK